MSEYLYEFHYDNQTWLASRREPLKTVVDLKRGDGIIPCGEIVLDNFSLRANCKVYNLIGFDLIQRLGSMVNNRLEGTIDLHPTYL